MARVFIRANALLPNKCICCGADADTLKKKRFSAKLSYTEGDLVATFLVLVFSVGTLLYLGRIRHATIELPFCNSHKRYWIKGRMFLWCGLIISSVVTTAALTFGEVGRPHGAWYWAVVATVIGFGLPAVFLLVYLRRIKAVAIDDSGITLINVDKRFAEAVGGGYGSFSVSRVIWCRECNIPYTTEDIKDNKCPECGNTI